jgi:hypothetical protein
MQYTIYDSVTGRMIEDSGDEDVTEKEIRKVLSQWMNPGDKIMRSEIGYCKFQYDIITEHGESASDLVLIAVG